MSDRPAASHSESSAQPFEFQVGGSLPLEAMSYVRRQADADLSGGLKAGRFCYVLNSRQTDGEVEFAGADDGAVAGGRDCLCGDRYDGDRVGGGDGGAVVFGCVVGDRQAGAGADGRSSFCRSPISCRDSAQIQSRIIT